MSSLSLPTLAKEVAKQLENSNKDNIELIQENEKLKKEIERLKKENEKLKEEIQENEDFTDSLIEEVGTPILPNIEKLKEKIEELKIELLEEKFYVWRDNYNTYSLNVDLEIEFLRDNTDDETIVKRVFDELYEKEGWVYNLETHHYDELYEETDEETTKE